MSNLESLQHDLKQRANPEKAKQLSRFFKTGPGQYGDGDRFLGITMPELRKLAKSYAQLELRDLSYLLNAPEHEARMIGLIIILNRFKKLNTVEQHTHFEFLLNHLKAFNNWDLIDVIVPGTLGDYFLKFPDQQHRIWAWIRSDDLWERRIALLSSFAFIRKMQTELSFQLAEQVLQDKQDLIHKASGWMLREAGKRNPQGLIDFLDRYAAIMPRTMLRYAIEKLTQVQKNNYMQAKNNTKLQTKSLSKTSSSVTFELILQHELIAMPGVSSLAWTPDGLYALADNMSLLYLLNPDDFSVCQRFQLDPELMPEGLHAEIPKAFKPDYEASAIMTIDGRDELWLLGSGSKVQTRENLIRFDLMDQSIKKESLAEMYQQLAQHGIDINIEGATGIGNQLLIANRGHQGLPVNYLATYTDQHLIRIQTLTLPGKSFIGISSLEYLVESDRLWFTASSEETVNSYDDGAIGDSYLGWIDQFSQHSQQTDLKADALINLSELDLAFKDQKIEALAINGSQFYLAADNDGLAAKIFMLRLIPNT